MLPVQNRLVLLKKKVIANVFMVASMYFWYQNKFPLSTRQYKKTRVDTINGLGTVGSYNKGTKTPCIFNDIVLFKHKCLFLLLCVYLISECHK